MKTVKVIKIICLCLVIVLFSCSQKTIEIRNAYKLMEDGLFYTALNSFHRLERKNPNNSRIIAGMGMLLSLKRISIFSAIDLLQTSLEKRSNSRVRRQLVIIYILLGQVERIMDITQLENVYEKTFTPSILQLHIATDCITSPSLLKLKKMETNLKQAENRLYYFFCELALIKNDNDKVSLLNSYHAIKNNRMQCESLGVFSKFMNDTTYNFIKIEKEKCLKKFPGLIALSREDLNLIKHFRSVSKNEKKLFGIEPFAPLDKGPEGWRRPFIKAKSDLPDEAKLEEVKRKDNLDKFEKTIE